MKANCGEYIIVAIDMLDVSGKYLIGFSNSIWSNSLDSDQNRPIVCPDLRSNCCKCYLQYLCKKIYGLLSQWDGEHILRYEKRK